MWKFCAKTQFLHCFMRFTRNYAEEWAFPQKFPHQEIRWNYGILRSVSYLRKQLHSPFHSKTWQWFCFSFSSYGKQQSMIFRVQRQFLVKFSSPFSGTSIVIHESSKYILLNTVPICATFFFKLYEFAVCNFEHL